ncbi:plasmid replication, integration and excision activator [Rhizohabitans arisaemae]|uniref:plasmid replication, integration and excision activator n=1 Tax=Rhizohabitans arisaemae TaxID=2720610 RepID=UPI0031FEE301
MTGEVTPVLDFEASTPAKPVPSRDKETGEPVWSVPVLDADPAAKAAGKSLAVKISSPVQPVVPEIPAQMAALGLPFTPVVFEGMTVTPYVNGQGRLAYSFRASGMRGVAAAGSSPAPRGGKAAEI